MSAEPESVGEHLRRWRQHRRLSQLQLALDTGVSARHISFLETGRSAAGRSTLTRLLSELRLPLREQNRLLSIAGYAPAFPERDLSHPDLRQVRDAVRLIVDRHPYPAVAFDRHWSLIAANRPMLALTRDVTIDASLLAPPINIVRLGLHPRGLAPLILNYESWRAQIRQRIARQMHSAPGDNLTALIAELDSYPSPVATSDPTPPDDGPLGPLHLRTADGRHLSFLGMLASFDTPFEVTASEIAIELLFPADTATAHPHTQRPIGPTSPEQPAPATVTGE